MRRFTLASLSIVFIAIGCGKNPENFHQERSDKGSSSAELPNGGFSMGEQGAPKPVMSPIPVRRESQRSKPKQEVIAEGEYAHFIVQTNRYPGEFTASERTKVVTLPYWDGTSFSYCLLGDIPATYQLRRYSPAAVKYCTGSKQSDERVYVMICHALSANGEKVSFATKSGKFPDRVRLVADGYEQDYLVQACEGK